MKKLLKFIFIGLIIVLVIGFLVVQYLKSDFYNPFDNKKFEHLKTQIDSSNELPSEFVKVFNEINPITNTDGIITDRLKEKFDRECPCLSAGNISLVNEISRFKINQYVLGWKLEKEFTQKECLNYYVQNFDFLNNSKGLNSASEFYFNKRISDLNYEELATLVLMLKNPTLYNPKRYPERLKEKLSELKN
ncbi:transglycosylase domain-containing protein [Psychroflexus aestuariivivens]|uniref:transglycosylase domain-containing protein n=1 Tax=Psychroflexus aestuariivivens TaxID=1795040 RepID=UPI000FDA58CE|nr:transglycosylase domain-containing protein [Psychroflexus aestuariivivens]